MICLPASVALGEVQQVEAVSFEFTIQNRGDKPCKITDVSKPCSCTSIDLPVDLIIAPRTTQKVRGEMRTIDRRGHYGLSVLIRYEFGTSTPTKANAKFALFLPISVDVLPAIKSSQEFIALDKGVESRLILSPGTSAAFAITDVSVSDRFISYDFDDSTLGVQTDRFQVRLSLKQSVDLASLSPGVRPELGRYWIEFKTSEPSEPTIRLPISIGPAQK